MDGNKHPSLNPAKIKMRSSSWTTAERAKIKVPVLSLKEQRFCDEYIANNCMASHAAIAVGYKKERGSYILKKECAQRYIKGKMLKLAYKTELTFEYKIGKIKKIIDICAPDDLDTIDASVLKTAINAIAEHNKMVGDYAPEKRANINVNLNTDTDVLQAKDIANQLIEQHKKPY